MLITYELKKLWGNKVLLIFIVIMLIAAAIITFMQSKNGASDLNAQSADQTLEGEITAPKFYAVAAKAAGELYGIDGWSVIQRNNVPFNKNAVMTEDALGLKAGDAIEIIYIEDNGQQILWNYKILPNYLNVYEWQSLNQARLDNYRGNIEWHTTVGGDKLAIVLAEYAIDKYTKIQAPEIYFHTDGWEALYNALSMDLFSLFLIIFITSAIFSDEHGDKVFPILMPTALRKKMLISKIITAVMTAMLSVIIISLIICVAAAAQNYLPYAFEGRLQNIRSYSESPLNLSLAGFLAFLVAIKLIAALIASGITMFFSSLLRNTYVTSILTACAILLPLILDKLTQKEYLRSLLFSQIHDSSLVYWFNNAASAFMQFSPKNILNSFFIQSSTLLLLIWGAVGIIAYCVSIPLFFRRYN